MGSLTRAERNIKWLERNIRVPDGRDAGKALRLRLWQKEGLRKIYDNPHGTRLAILSLGKKNGKSTLAAALLLLHLVGPEYRPNSQLPSTAQSKEQAAILFNLAAKMVRLNPKMDAAQGGAVIVRDTVKELYCPELGTLYRALSAEVRTTHGISPVFAVHDELGQVKGPVSELYAAVENSMGAHDDPMSIIISTQAPTDADLLSVLIDDAQTGVDSHVVVIVYTAPLDADAYSDETLKMANPAAGDYLNLRELRKQANDAKRMPAQEAIFRNFVLNQRVEVTAPFVSRSAWAACSAPPKPLSGYPVYGGLDLSAINDLTAFLAGAKIDGVWSIEPYFWMPGDAIADRARADRVPYDVWHRENQLLAAPGKSVDYEFVAGFLWDFCQANDVRQIGFDRWNFKHLKPWLLKAGFTEERIAEIFVEFGQGFASMSPALRTLEGEILNARIAHGDHPVLKMCMGNAVVTSDPAGNRKLVKARARGRIDGAVALANLMGVAPAGEVPQAVHDYSITFI
ncbi:phage terminase family protein [Mesorhizobium sp. ESP7-2]|uniref:terminase TerL endonuclease subunit n=1 Tax=Mesorhizobium sp. ESP7-2 TaxID=2876622 RepID=UPI001CD02BED|nr:terminase TerL endonuclease subunit [Mesorhizobium sp. ESP7-2]MBZ9710485.1 phage terminase family protein [Mesorhizobium sp. ESP7-2]